MLFLDSIKIENDGGYYLGQIGFLKLNNGFFLIFLSHVVKFFSLQKVFCHLFEFARLSNVRNANDG